MIRLISIQPIQLLMNRRFFLFLVTACFLSFSLSAQNTASLDKTVKELSRDASLSHAVLAVSVYSIDKQQEVFGYGSQQAVAPASVTKLFTTAAGFDKLGSDFRFTTTLAYSGVIDEKGTLRGDVYILGGGDPLLGSYRYKQTVPDTLFATWQRAMSRAGIRAVEGHVCYDATVFDNHPVHDSWQWSDIGNYYGSGVSGINFHENMFFIYYNSGGKVGASASVDHLSPQGIAVNVINEVTTGAAQSGDQVIIYGDPVATIRTCTGTVPLEAKNFAVRASLPRPGQVCADLFTTYLRSHKISVSGASSEVSKRPSGLTTLVDFTSPAYSVIAQYTNVTSNNTYAEAIYKYMGYKVYGLGTYANGARVVGDFLKSSNIDTQGIRLEDGSGLSRCDRVTTDFVCRFLVAMSQKPFFKDYFGSLAVAGESGTVKGMLKDLPSGVKVHMKTGSMNGVRAFAGYVANAKGARYSFAVICNNYDCTGAQIRSKLEKIIRQIATLE